MTPPAASPAAPPPRGGTLVLAWQEPETLNALRGAGAQTNQAVYAVAVEGLTRVGPEGDFLPALAEDVPTIESGSVTLGADGRMRVRYRLRSGLRWSDGQPLTSADVRFTWRLVMSDPKVVTREGYELIEDVDTPDERTAVVRYRTLYPAYLTRFDAIVPRHLLDGGGEAALVEYGRKPVGTGPFRIVEFVAGSHVTAERNPYYRDAAKPYLDRLVFRFVPSIEAAKAQLRAGEVQANLSVGEADAAELERTGGVALDQSRSPLVEAVAFNFTRPGDPADPAVSHPLLADARVRRALLLATPKRDVVDRLLSGRAAVAHSEIPIGWAAPKELRQEERDVEAARRLLDAAGWPVGPDGVRRREGVRASLRLVGTTGNRLREQVQQVLVDAWRAVGVEGTIRNVPPATLVGSWSSGGIRKRGDFDAVIAQLGLGGVGGVDPQGYLAQRHRCDAIPRRENGGAGANYERFCDRRVDALLDEAGRTLARETRAARYGEVLRILNDEVVAIWLYERARINAYAPTVGGYRANPWDVATWNVEDWYVGPASR